MIKKAYDNHKLGSIKNIVHINKLVRDKKIITDNQGL